MGGAVMLLMVAAVGITYGWTPDGGNGVKYIIQIPPEKIDQVVRAGEISSQIPDEVRGHVSEIVVRIGHGAPPRITPSHLAAQSTSRSRGGIQTVSGTGVDDRPVIVACPPNRLAAPDRLVIEDSIPMPIPSMGRDGDLKPIQSSSAAATAMMKPSPQGGGMNLPGGFGMTPATGNVGNTNPANANAGTRPGMDLQQTARDAYQNIGDQVRASADAGRQQVQQNINEAAGRINQSANSQMQSAANQLRDTVGQAFGSPTNPNAPSAYAADDPRLRLAPGTDPASNRSNDAATNQPDYGRAGETRQTAEPNPYTRGGARTPSTEDGAPPPAFATSRSSAGSSPFSGNPNGGIGNDPTARTAAEEKEWYDLRNENPRRPSTDPLSTDSLTSGRQDRRPDANPPTGNFGGGSSINSNPGTGNFNGGNFARLPGGLQTDRDSDRAAAGTSDLEYDPRLTPAQAQLLPPGGYSFNGDGEPIDRQGYRLNRFGQRIDRYGYLMTATANIGNPSKTDDGQSQTDRSYRYPDNNGYSSNPPPLIQPPLAPNSPAYANNGNPNSSTGGNFPATPDFSRTPNPQSPNYQTGYQTPPPQPPSYQAPGYQASGYQAPGYQTPTYQTSGYQAPAPNYPSQTYASNPPYAAEPRRAPEDNIRSASDGGRGGKDLVTTDDKATNFDAPFRSEENVAAQPIFNAMLLLSVVVNVYLMSLLRKLHTQFRDMVASKRATANAGSIAAA